MTFDLRRFVPLAAMVALTFSVASMAHPSRSVSAAAASGLYSPAQAKTGEVQYEAHCAQCHGARLEGGAGPPLSGPNMTTLGAKTHLTVGDMFSYITSNMPMDNPGGLKHDQYLAILAYILKQNGYPAGSKALTYAGASSSKLKVQSYK